MDLNPLSQTLPSISAGSKRIFPNRAAAVQTILDDSHVLAGIAKFIFEHTRPALIKSESVPGLGDDSPAYRVAVDQHVVHERSPPKSMPRAAVVWGRVSPIYMPQLNSSRNIFRRPDVPWP